MYLCPLSHPDSILLDSTLIQSTNLDFLLLLYGWRFLAYNRLKNILTVDKNTLKVTDVSDLLARFSRSRFFMEMNRDYV